MTRSRLLTYCVAVVAMAAATAGCGGSSDHPQSLASCLRDHGVTPVKHSGGDHWTAGNSLSGRLRFQFTTGGEVSGGGFEGPPKAERVFESCLSTLS